MNDPKLKTGRSGDGSDITVEQVRDRMAGIGRHPGSKTWLAVLAMDRSTHALEAVTDAFCAGHRGSALELFRAFREQLRSQAVSLLPSDNEGVLSRMEDLFTEVEWLLHDRPVRDFDYYYDQVTCIGSLLASVLVWGLIRQEGIAAEWVDARDCIRTDDRFRSASVDRSFTADRLSAFSQRIFATQDVIVTQAGIGATDENESTTLGKDGADATLAVLTECLNAEVV